MSYVTIKYILKTVYNFFSYIWTESYDRAKQYANLRRTVTPQRYNFKREVKRRQIDRNEALDIKVERIIGMRNAMENVNMRVIRGEKCEEVDLTVEDIAVYQELYNSDHEDEDYSEEDDSEEDEQMVEQSRFNKIDIPFSGNHRFATDVSVVPFSNFPIIND